MTAAAVLLVEDESALLTVFARWFTREGYRVITAADGVEALAVVQREAIDLVVTDIRMPNMDGIELVRRLKDVTRYVPKAMFVSGNAEISERDMFDLGVEAFLSKPIDRTDMLAAARTCLTDRAVLWRGEPSGPAPEQVLRATYDSIGAARDAGHLAFGRGGFCAAVDPLRFHRAPIGLDIRFRQERHGVVGQAAVRWVDPKECLIGVEIKHVTDAERAWTVAVTAAAGTAAFIPRDVAR